MPYYNKMIDWLIDWSSKRVCWTSGFISTRSSAAAEIARVAGHYAVSFLRQRTAVHTRLHVVSSVGNFRIWVRDCRFSRGSLLSAVASVVYMPPNEVGLHSLAGGGGVYELSVLIIIHFGTPLLFGVVDYIVGATWSNHLIQIMPFSGYLFRCLLFRRTHFVCRFRPLPFGLHFRWPSFSVLQSWSINSRC